MNLSPISRSVPVLPLLLVAVLGSGCSAVHVDVSEPTPLKEFIKSAAQYSVDSYRIVPGDQLTVRFYFNPQLDDDIRVRPDGNVSLSLIGELKATGTTPAELSDSITNAYSQFFLKSKAVVIVRQFNEQRVFTAGELKRPGQIDLLSGPRTVLDSISASGGVTDEATLKNVVVMRRLPGREKPMVIAVNIADALSGEAPEQNLALLPNDVVYVPKSDLADANLVIHQLLYNNFNFSTSIGATYGLGGAAARY